MTLTWHECDWDNPETRPTEPGPYAVMISGDNASVDGHVLYDFPDYQTFASVWLEEGEVQIAPSHDEPIHAIFAWCGPLPIPKFDPTAKSESSTIPCKETLDPAEIDAILADAEALSGMAQPSDRP
ncbi:hypothetical protein [Microvirga massiliensis]|uniref:hypothetical protein n=1 Tax=Microvirga massiliensis TaxID=1033741 RepID=UPI00062B54B0|nr:hypothetical protein [Microvirga massiliensis]